MPLFDNQQGQDDAAQEILNNVELKSFKAVPAAIMPFGASVLKWEVTGPAGFGVQLNLQSVAKKASESCSQSVPRLTN